MPNLCFSSASDSRLLRSAGRLTPLQLASNRPGAQKSTGPRTEAGKYRSALNAKNRRMLPEAVERDLRACGEDPREFLPLYLVREIIAETAEAKAGETQSSEPERSREV